MFDLCCLLINILVDYDSFKQVLEKKKNPKMKPLGKKKFCRKERKKKAGSNSIAFELSQMRRQPINDSFCVSHSIFINPSDMFGLSED